MEPNLTQKIMILVKKRSRDGMLGEALGGKLAVLILERQRPGSLDG